MRCRKLKNRLLLLAALVPCILEAQVTADCPGAIVVCGDQLITLEGGPGLPDFNNPNNQLGDCQLTGETESVWIYFRFRTDMPDSSIIEFTIDPVEDGEIDYDFSLYAADTPCDSLGSPVRCSYAWVFSNNQFSCGFCPLTGLGNGELDVSEGPFGNGYLAPLAVYPGQGFYLYVNEFYDDAGASSGFNISFGGSAAPYLDCLANPNCPQMVVDAGRDTTVCSGDIPFQLIGSATFATGYEIYTWTGEGGEETFLDDPNSPQPTVTFPPNFEGQITYVLTVESGGCIHRDTLRLNVLPSGSFSLSGPASFCTGDTVTLTASSGFDSYLWSNGSTAESIEVSEGGLYSVTVTAAGNNCTIAKEIEVTEHPLPQVSISGDSALCTGDTLLLDAGPGFETVSWQNGAIGRFLPVTQAGDYAVAVVDSNGCAGADSKNIIEIAPPEPEIFGPAALCPDDEATLSVFSIYSAYLWSTGDFMPELNTSDPGVYTIQVWDEYGCQGMDTLNIAALPGPDPEIFGPDTICYGANTALAVSPNFASYLWSTGSTAPSILADESGHYSITVANAEGCSAADTLSFTELPPLAININILGNSVLCTGDTLFLQATPGFASYEWQSGAVGPVSLATAGGSYAVEVKDEWGCAETAALEIEELPPPQPAIDGPEGLCPAASATLQVGNYATYEWSDGSNDPELTIDAPGAYAVTVSDNNGCTGTASLAVTAYSSPAPRIIGPDSLCEGTSALLAVGGGPFDTYQWQNNAAGPQLVISTGGEFMVTVTNADGCSATDTLAVELLSQPQIPLPSALSFCENEMLDIDAGAGFAVYSWSTGASSQVIAVGQAGVYSVTVTGNNGCINSQDIAVTSNPIPEPEVSGSLLFCQNSSTTLTLEPGGYESIRWSTGGTSMEEAFDTSGEFSVLVTDTNGCAANYAFRVEELGPTPVDISGDSLACEGETIVLGAGPGYGSYLWSNGENADSVAVTSGGAYMVTVTNELGCEGYDTLFVRFQPLPAVALADTMILCEDGELLLDAGDGPYFYTWDDGQNTSAILIDAPGIYDVEVLDSLGCVARDEVAVLEIDVPSPQIEGSLRLCPGDSSLLVVNEPYEEFYWSTGVTGNELLVTQAGFYTLTVTDQAGCQGTANILVNGVPAPEAAITGPREVCAGTTAILDAGNHTEYLWSNGHTGPQLAATEEGLYNVVVTNFFGCRDTAWAGLRILPLPDPGLQEDAFLCEGSSVVLRADTGFTYYLWEDGSSGPIREVDAPGEYVLIVSDGSCSGQDTVEVRQQPAPQPIVLGGATVCPGEEATLEVQGEWPAVSWSNGGVASSTTVTEPGTYTVTVADSLGCRGAGTAQVENFETVPPVLDGDPGFCPGESATLSLLSSYAAYNWSTGSTNPSITVNSPGNYSVTATDANGCSATAAMPVYALAPPQANIGGEPEFCAGSSTQIFAFGDNQSYIWSTGDTSKLIVASQAGDYSVTVAGDNGCRAVASITVSELPLPQPQVLGGQFCRGDSSVLYVEEQFNTYLWENGSTSPTLTVDTPGLYGLTITDQNGCVGAVSEQVEELPLPEPEIIGGSPICLGIGATTDISVDGAYQEYRWNTGEQTPSIAVGTTDVYSVVVTDANGCQGAAEFTLQALPAPSLEILGDSVFCRNGSTVLEAVTDGDSLLWFDGSAGGQVAIEQPGAYFVTAFGDNGCKTTDTIAVEEIIVPAVSAGPPQAIDCREEAVQLGSPSNPVEGLQYSWSGPGINDENRNLPMPLVGAPGVYTVEVVQTTHLCSGDPVEVVVEDLRYLPEASLNVMDTLDCSTPTVTVNSTVQGEHFAFQWYDGLGAPLTGGNGQTLEVSAGGAYTLVVTDTLLGCSAAESVVVAVDYAYPQVNAGPEGLLNCYAPALELSGSVLSESSNLVYTWTSSDGHFVGLPEGLNPTVDAPGLYFLTVLDQDSGCESRDSVRVRQDIEAPVADAGADQEIGCLEQAATLDGGNSSRGVEFQYQWSPENGNTIVGTLQPTVNQPGTYYLSVTNLVNGCSSIDEAIVFETENYLRGMQLAASGPLCFGERNGFIAVNEIQGGSEPFLYSINGEPFVSRPQFTNLPAGAYEVRVQDAAGCEYSLETFLEDGNDVEVRLGGDLELQLGDEVTLQALTNLAPEEIGEVVWSFPIDTFPCLDPKCLVKELQMQESALIRATVIDTNGCRASDEIQLILNKSRNVYIPNAFSPNGDGANDYFTIFANGGEVVQVRRLMIMTRWGEQVFAKLDFPPNVPQMGWDGRHRGRALDPAVFAYFAEIEFIDGEVELFEGSLTLVK